MKALLIVLLFLQSAFADWYILFPKEVREKAKKAEERPPVKEKQSVKVKRIACPDFSVTTSDLKEISLSSLDGKKVVILFIKGAFAPDSESLLKALDSIKAKGVVFIAVDVVESEFPLLSKLKESLGLNSVNLTADQFLLKQIRRKVPLEGLPAVIFVDRYGYIRLYSDNLSGVKADSFKVQVELALSKIP